MNLLGLRKFAGTTMQDVTRYLQVDVHKAILDLTTVLQAKQRFPQVLAINERGIAMGSSATAFSVLALQLPAGRWHITGHTYFDRAATGHRFGVTRLWLSRRGDGDIPLDAIQGYNYSVFNTVIEDMEELSMFTHWALEIEYTQTVYMRARSVYGGGAGVPLCHGSIVATGYITE